MTLEEAPEDVVQELRARGTSLGVLSHYIAVKLLPDKRIIGVHRLLMHWTLHVDINEIGYEDNYCYESLPRALTAMEEWDGTGDPKGWHRNPKTGRRVNEQGEVYIAW